MGKLLSFFGGSWIMPAIVAVGLASVGGYILVLKNEIKDQRVTIAEQRKTIAEANASIGIYKQKAMNQETLVKFANIAAKEAGASGAVWKARFAKAKTERPPAADTYAGELQMCLGTVEWFRSQYNAIAKEWNDAK